MIISISIVGDKEVIAKLGKMPATVHAALLQKVTTLALKLEAYIKKNKLSGQVLNRKTGRLARSITHAVDAQPHAVWGRVFSTGDVPYAGIHEYGGQTGAHIILPKKASVLAFVKDGQKVFARKVNHPGSTMPERSYMRSSLREMSVEISTAMKEAVLQGAKRAME